MKKVTLYSRSGRGRVRERPAAAARRAVRRSAAAQPDRCTGAGRAARRWRTAIARYERALLRRRRRAVRARPGLGPRGLFAGAGDAHPEGNRRRRPVHAGERPDAVARGEVVRRRAAVGRARARPDRTTSARTATRPKAWAPGVVIVDTGIILTNLHVVNGADAGARSSSSTASSPKPPSSACDRSTISPCCRRRSCPTISRPPRCARPAISPPATR